MRQTLSLDQGWLFHLGDVPAPLANTHLAAYMANKAGYARGPAKPAYDDTDWRTVDIPHDWSVEGPFHPGHPISNGYLPRGTAWYRRHFALDESDRSRHLSLRFDGVASHCTVYVNGHLLHRNHCGYTPFTIDITDVATFGEDVNTIAVHVDATHPEGWWYEGAGLYRHVWLTKTSRADIATNGVFINPTRTPAGTWNTHIETTIDNTSDDAVDLDITQTILDPSGTQRHQTTQRVRIGPRAGSKVVDIIPVAQPHLWSPDTPHLYTLHTQLRQGGHVIDEVSTTFGYRTLRFDADEGFFLNDQPLKLLGTCNHQDHAGVGVAVPDSIWAFRVRRLKEMGTNAYRSAHNPPAPAFLDACDRLGMLVIDENRNFGSSPEHLAQLRAMIRRDRNHPCIILWSICNEEAIQGTPVGGNIARALQHTVQQLDPSRPVTAAVSGGLLNEHSIADTIDILGINYQLPQHAAVHARYPDKPLYAAETHCVLATRGVYATDAERKMFSSLDADVAPWGRTARETWRHVSSTPYLAGLFIWTGFDYRGEPTPHEWPCVSSQFGLLDTCGFPKAGFHLHKAFFTKAPFVHLEPHWNWTPGQEVRVVAYTNCPEVELFLNAESLGRKPVDRIDMVEWTLPFRPGTLHAVAYRDGQRVADHTLTTTGPAVAVGLEIDASADASTVPADGTFALPVTVFATDNQNLRVPTASHPITFTLTGPARILGSGNGDPASHEPDASPTRSLFHGRAQLILQTTSAPGTIQLTAISPGLRPAVLTLHSQPVPTHPYVLPARRRHYLGGWRVSPITPTRPVDVDPQTLEKDVNTWDRIEPGPERLTSAATPGYRLYRTRFTPPKALQATGGRIRFHCLAGQAEVYLNRQLLTTKPAPDPAPLEVAFRPTAEPLTLSVLIPTTSTPSGLAARVELTPP